MALLPTLVGKDPEMALNRFIKKAGDRRSGSSFIPSLERAIKIWAEKDSRMACAWLDRKIASGVLEGNSISGVNETRLHLEQSLFKALLPNSPQSAGDRLMAMNTDEAFLLMGNLVSSATARENPDKFAALSRQSLSDTQSIRILAQAASLPSMDYAAVSAYLDKINASPAEREACVSAAAERIIGSLASHRGVTIEEVDAMRSWAGAQHPSIDRLTGKSLGNSIHSEGMSFAEASELADHYHQTTGNDEVIIGFLSSNAHCDIDGSRVLAEKISDPSIRAEMLENLK
jgi:hypothetical protein